MVSWRSKIFLTANRVVLRRLLIIGGSSVAVTTAFSLLQVDLSGSARLRTVLVNY